MTVYINEKPVVIFSGARIRDAVLAYSARSCKLLLKGNLTIFDRFGNPTEPDGPLTEGQH